MYAIADCNNFYASCERVFQPDLNGKAIIVLSNNDGCVIARSNEAKALGIKMGVPAFKIKDVLRKHNVKTFSSNYALYGDMSQRVQNILKAFSSEMEVYSIDEVFMNLAGMKYTDLNEYAQKIKKVTTKSTGIPISIGIGPTKTLAKLANYFSKRYPAYKGVCIIKSEEQIQKSLSLVKVGDIWGVGRQYAKFLGNHGICTAKNFVDMPNEWIKKNMSVVGLRTKKELLGTPCISLELNPPSKKAICTSRSFGTMVKDLKTLEESVASYASKCAKKLRQQKSCANTITIFIHTNPFRKQDPQYAQNIVVQLPVASNSTLEIINYSLRGLRKIFKEGYNYKKAGVIVSGIVNENVIQAGLFDKVDRWKHKDLMRSMDKLNKGYGKEVVKSAIQGTGKKWGLRQEKLSPCYSTKWDDIITVLSG